IVSQPSRHDEKSRRDEAEAKQFAQVAVAGGKSRTEEETGKQKNKKEDNHELLLKDPRHFSAGPPILAKEFQNQDGIYDPIRANVYAKIDGTIISCVDAKKANDQPDAEKKQDSWRVHAGRNRPQCANVRASYSSQAARQRTIEGRYGGLEAASEGWFEKLQRPTRIKAEALAANPQKKIRLAHLSRWLVSRLDACNCAVTDWNWRYLQTSGRRFSRWHQTRALATLQTSS